MKIKMRWEIGDHVAMLMVDATSMRRRRDM